MSDASVMWKRLTANRRQFGVMLALVVVALLMWGKLLLKNSPRPAAAAPVETKQAAVKDILDALDPLERRQTVRVELPDQSRRDPFALDFREFPKIEVPKVNEPQNPVVEKSDEARRAGWRAKLGTLVLQSTIVRDQPQALMNGRLFQVGSEPLEGFTITRITEHSVFVKPVESEEEFELRMYRK